jgi:hypothetical protein
VFCQQIQPSVTARAVYRVKKTPAKTGRLLEIRTRDTFRIYPRCTSKRDKLQGVPTTLGTRSVLPANTALP